MTDRKDRTDEPDADKAASGIEAGDVQSVNDTVSADEGPNAGPGEGDRTEMSSTEGGSEREEPTPARPPRSKALLVLVLLLFAIVIGAGVAGYWAWRQLEDIRTVLAGVESQSSTQTSALVEQQKQAEAAREELSAGVAGASARISALGESVDTLNLRLTEAEQAQPQALVMAEIAYLLELAANRLNLERDRPGALLALDRALARLHDVPSPAYVTLTETIVAERAQLEAVDATDAANVVSRISAMVETVDDIDIASEKLTPDPEAPTNGSAAVQNLKGIVSSMVDNLGQFVKIERAASASPPTLIPDQKYYARENVRLSLKHARSAALRTDTANLNLGLNEVKRWLRHFPMQGVVAEMDAEIEALLALDLDIAYPQLSGSLAIARQLSAEPAEETRSPHVESSAEQSADESSEPQQ